MRSSFFWTAIVCSALAACASGNDPIPSGKYGECARCHLPEYTSAPKHPGVKPTTCSICHAETSWHPLKTLNHPWALTGAHQKAQCSACHVGSPPAYHGTSKKCVDCHRKEYDRHHHGEVAVTCADCHSTDSWKHATKSKKQKPSD
jgi:hypothetical protein